MSGGRWARVAVVVAVVLGGVMMLREVARGSVTRGDAAATARARMQAEVARAVEWMDRVLDEAARLASLADVDEAPDEGLALLEAMRPALRLPGVPPQARLALYDRHDKDSPYLGRATAAGVTSPGVGIARAGLAPSAVERLAPSGSETGWSAPSPLWLWFEADPAGGVRLARSIVLHQFVVLQDEDDPEPALAEGVHLLTVDVPFVFEGAASVRCDVVEGAVRDEVAWTRLGPEDGRATRDEECLAPRWSPWRFPGAPDAPRALAHLPPPPVEREPWWMYAAAFVVACGALFASWRRAAPPVRVPDVTAEAAHEMRTPLTAMRGALEVALRRERSPKEYQETLHLCLEEVRGLQNLQDAVLFLSRGARTEPAKEEVDLGALVEAEVARVKAAHAERALQYDGPAQALTLQGDPSLLARLVGNLLDNAALHSVPGGAIRAALTREHGSAVLTVEDDGPGVPAARRERIFERFFRGPEAARRGIPGSGLGLPIARWLAEVHGGTLELDPEATDRARFRLRLPLA